MIAGDDIVNNVVNLAEDMVEGDHNEAKDITDGINNHNLYIYITASKMSGNQKKIRYLL